jgi:hypothetical protein
MKRFTSIGINSQNGVALAIVVWFLAAMSLLVSGIVFQGRVDVQLAQLHVARAKATASGDGAIQLMLASLVSTHESGSYDGGMLRREFEVGDRHVTVELVPVIGLINLKEAPKAVLAQLFFIPGDVDERSAQILADSVIKWRIRASQEAERNGQGARFSAVEDLLRVEGITRTHLDRIADVIYVGKAGGALPDWRSAPDALLDLVSGQNKSAAAVSALRGAAEGGTSPDGANRPGPRSSVLSGVVRADAIVSEGGRKWLRRRFVLMVSAESSRLPWRYSRTEPARVLADA